MLGSVERRNVRLIIREIIFEQFQRISSQSTNVTNRRTDNSSWQYRAMLRIKCLSMYSPQMAFCRHRTDDQMTSKNHFALNTVF